MKLWQWAIITVQVVPSNIEKQMMTHPDVEEVGVVGQPDECDGELPLAFVVLRKGAIATAEELINYTNGNPESKWLKHKHEIRHYLNLQLNFIRRTCHRGRKTSRRCPFHRSNTKERTRKNCTQEANGFIIKFWKSREPVYSSILVKLGSPSPFRMHTETDTNLVTDCINRFCLHSFQRF